MNNPLIVLLIIIGVAAVIAVAAFLIYRFTHPKIKDEKPSEEQFLQEEMDRVLKPIEDEEVAKQVSEYKDDEEDQ